MIEEDPDEPYRLRQAEKILSLFETAHGRPARSIDELNQWVASPEGSRILADGPDGSIIPDDGDY
jgi:hypothetical protein